jgi:cell division septum initiation protein DivIVA
LRVEDKEFLDLVKERLEAFEQTNKAHEAKAKE